jgi:hypothetical protein
VENTSKENDESIKELTFKPHIYTAPLKKFEGSARELNDKSGVDHIRRQMRARKEKDSVL